MPRPPFRSARIIATIYNARDALCETRTVFDSSIPPVYLCCILIRTQITAIHDTQSERYDKSSPSVTMEIRFGHVSRDLRRD